MKIQSSLSLKTLCKISSRKQKNYTLEDHFVRIPWAECMRRFGSDKPDMRFGNEIQDITSVFENTEFQVFKNTIENGGVVNCVKFEMRLISIAAKV